MVGREGPVTVWPGSSAFLGTLCEASPKGATECVVPPPVSSACRTTLLQLQVTARSLLGAVVLNSGGMLPHHGWCACTADPAVRCRVWLR
ncbi:DUF2625 family protein [Lentzea atacamensis]|uniref:DUF2625 family protein n=1 Tax=Lentzea atacamensis TaxID=531938 RepID=UPI001B85EE54